MIPTLNSRAIKIAVLTLFWSAMPGFFGLSDLPVFAASPAEQTVQQLVSLFAGMSQSGADQRAMQEASGQIDYALMAERSLTAAQWQAMTPAQRRELRATLQALLQMRYYPRWRKIFSRSKVSIIGESTRADDVFVTTHVCRGSKKDTVIWQLHSSHGQYRAVDLIVNGKDLHSRLASNFQRRYQRAGYRSLIGWLQTKTNSSTVE